MEDVRHLVPRKPPEGLENWVKEHGGLEKHAILYSAEWMTDYSMESILCGKSGGRKKKVVRTTCTACGAEEIYQWTESASSYGFMAEMEQGYAVVSSGDEMECPTCGTLCKVHRRAEISGTGYLTADKFGCMSAEVVGEQKYLALTCWHVERRVYKDGHEELNAQPVDAYVYGRDKENAKLTGWGKGYSGNAGYFQVFKRSWDQPKQWTENWGGVSIGIYGLTEQLIQESCLPDCKLDRYMAENKNLREKYPIAYLRLYQEHPNVENLVMNGLPMVLDDLIREQTEAYEWDNNKKGLPVLQEINWEEQRPAKMLYLTKESLRLAQKQCWGAYLWRVYVAAARQGEQLTEQDMKNAFYLADEDLLEVAGKAPLGRTMRYLMKQYELAGPGAEDEYGDPDPFCTLSTKLLLDYWKMAETLGCELNTQRMRYPFNLEAAHDEMTALVNAQKKKNRAKNFRKRRKELERFSFEHNGLLIRPARSQADLTKEGIQLNHCVGTYGNDHADGKTAIFFIRHVAEPNKSYFTLELDEKKLTVRQNRGSHNCNRTAEVRRFEKLWLAWIRAGAPRDQNGAPILGKGKDKTA